MGSHLRGTLVVGVLLAVCVLAVPAQATSVPAYSYYDPGAGELGLVFRDQTTGLSAYAVFIAGGQAAPGGPWTMDILLTNTADVHAPGFEDCSDRLLTGLYFDMGQPGINPGDPVILGGTARVADGSLLVGPAQKLPAGPDITAHWGYATYVYEGTPPLGPDFVSSLTAHATPFVPGAKLQGPDFGAVSLADPSLNGGLGLAAVADTVHLSLELSAMVDLTRIFSPENNMPYVEFGSDAAFVPDDPPGGPVPEPVTLAGLGFGLVSLTAYLKRRR